VNEPCRADAVQRGLEQAHDGPSAAETAWVQIVEWRPESSSGRVERRTPGGPTDVVAQT
jgi:hypothetical protein